MDPRNQNITHVYQISSYQNGKPIVIEPFETPTRLKRTLVYPSSPSIDPNPVQSVSMNLSLGNRKRKI
jgi:hypothetical protein